MSFICVKELIQNVCGTKTEYGIQELRKYLKLGYITHIICLFWHTQQKPGHGLWEMETYHKQQRSSFYSVLRNEQEGLNLKLSHFARFYGRSIRWEAT